MINFNTIDTLIYTWTVTYSGITVDWQNQNCPKSDLPYIALRRQSLKAIGHGFISDPDDSGIGKISGDREIIVNFQAYGNNAFGMLEDLWNVRLLDSSNELLRAGGLTLVDQLAILNITGLNDLEFEERASMDLSFGFVSQNDNVDLGLIETINIENNVKEPDKTQNFNIDLT